MSQAIKCDRCGKYYDRPETNRKIYGATIVGIRVRTHGPCCDYDLCSDCVEKLYEFMGIKPDKQDESETEGLEYSFF